MATRHEGKGQRMPRSSERSGPANKQALLDDSDSDRDGGGAAFGDSALKVNQDFARRFEVNKRRAELHRRKLAALFSPAFTVLTRP
jgi:protein KRI1